MSMAGDDRSQRALYIISVAAELTGVHPQTLRIYERKGLIEPARTEGRSRRYSERDIELLLRIQELTNAGLNLEGVRRVLELEDDLAAARGQVDELRAELDRTVARARAAVAEARREHRRDLVPLSRAVVRAPRPGSG